MAGIEVFVDLHKEIRAGLKVIETHRCLPNQPTETRAELRGRENAYRAIEDQLRRVICQHDRQGYESSFDAALAHLDAAARLMEGIEARGYKAEYAKGHCLMKAFPGAQSAVISLWHSAGK